MLFFYYLHKLFTKSCVLRNFKENDGSLVIKEIYEKEGILKTGEFLTFSKTIVFQN